MLLQGKSLLVTGVVSEQSIAFHVARVAQDEGADVTLTGFGRALRITRRLAEKLPMPCAVLEMDVTRSEQMRAVVDDTERRWGKLDGILHSVAYAPPTVLNGGFLDASWSDVRTAIEVSTYSFVSLSRSFAPLLSAAGGGSVVGLDFDASQVWPGYDWMGVAKAGLESCCRYLASVLGSQGTRVNLVASGPLRTVAANAIRDLPAIGANWRDRAPLGWDETDPGPVARTVCALLSDWMPQVTGEIVHVDGGAHAIGGPVVRNVGGPR